jgi:hypothetical protein
VRQIRMLRARRRELETGLRRLPHGHEGGNSGYGQGAAYGLPRQFPTPTAVLGGRGSLQALPDATPARRDDAHNAAAIRLAHRILGNARDRIRARRCWRVDCSILLTERGTTTAPLMTLSRKPFRIAAAFALNPSRLA